MELADTSTLIELDASVELTLILDRRAPLLHGKLTLTEFESILESEEAFEAAVDSYKIDLEYSVLEIQDIVLAVSATLLGRLLTYIRRFRFYLWRK